MKITIESTDRIVSIIVNGEKVPARVWEGTTGSGVRCYALITRIAHHKDDDNRADEFQRDLQEHRPPTDRAAQVFDLRYFLD